MSIVPMFFSDYFPSQTYGHGHGHNHHDRLDQHIPRTLMQHYLGQDLPLMNATYLQPWAQSHNAHKEVSCVKPDKDQFHVTLDVQQFKPEEINVKVVDKHVIVEAKHEDIRDDHGWVSRHFTRKYLIPTKCSTDEIRSFLSSDGVLTITAPKYNDKRQSHEKLIKIEHTGKPAILPKKSTNEVSDSKETK